MFLAHNLASPAAFARPMPRWASHLSLALALAWLGIASGCDQSAAAASSRPAASPADDHDHAEADPHLDDHGDEDPHDHDPAPPGEADHDAEHDHGDDASHEADHESGHVDEVTLTPEAMAHHGIVVEPAELRALIPTLLVPARVGFNAEAMAHVGSPLEGRVVRIDRRLGDTVAAGDTMLVIESAQLGQAQTDFLERREGVETVGPAVELARLAWERARSLHEESQGISLTEVQRREAEHVAAVASQRAARAAATAAEHRLALLGMDAPSIEALAQTGQITPRHAITAPLAGQVVLREVTLGEHVGPDHEPLMVVADLGTLWVLASVPDARVPELALGARAWVSSGILGRARHEAIVTYIAPMIDAATRTAQVRIELPAGTLGLRPGMFAQAEIQCAPADGTGPEPVLAVPEDAIQIVEGGPAVFVAVDGEPGTFAARPVTVGPAIGGFVPILSGLEPGEPVVVVGSFILKAELGKAGAAHEH